MKTIKTIKTIVVCLLALSFLGSCSDVELSPIEKNKTAPGKVTNVVVENIPGGAILSYTLPSDPDILYVLARYTEKGVLREFKASYYTNTLLVDGLSREEDYEIELVAYNRSEVPSEKVFVKIHPLTPPVMSVFASIEAKAAFGGVTFTLQNPTRATIAVGVLTTDAEGTWYERETFYTSLAEPKFSVRGFDGSEREFKAYVRDRWNNYSDTASYVLTPLNEIKLDKSLFKDITLMNDASSSEWGGQKRFIWDDRAYGDIEGEWGLHTGNAASETGEPKHITFDTGVRSVLSRFNLQYIMDDKHMFNDVSPRVFEIWGRDEAIDVVTDEGEFYPHWFKLGEMETIKPSGLPLGSLTDEDRAVCRAGFELTFEENEKFCRYIRVRCLNNWTGNTNMCFSEVTIYAQVVEPL
jgi:hypothetical protein